MLQMHAGTIVYNFNRFGGWSSLENMWYQVNQMGNDLMNISQQHPEGVHFLGSNTYLHYLLIKQFLF